MTDAWMSEECDSWQRNYLRTLKNSANDFVLFNTVRYWDSDDFSTQQQSYRSPFRTDLTCLDIKRILTVICGWSSSDMFCQSEYGTYQDARTESACQLLINTLLLIFCFIASITATLSSEVPSPGKGRHHILLFEELSPQTSSFEMIFESTSHLFNPSTPRLNL